MIKLVYTGHWVPSPIIWPYGARTVWAQYDLLFFLRGEWRK